MGKLVLYLSASGVPVMEIATHFLATPGVHIQGVVEDLGLRRAFVDDAAHPGRHLVAGAVLRAESEQADGVHEIDEAVRAVSRGARRNSSSARMMAGASARPSPTSSTEMIWSRRQTWSSNSGPAANSS